MCVPFPKQDLTSFTRFFRKSSSVSGIGVSRLRRKFKCGAVSLSIDMILASVNNALADVPFDSRPRSLHTRLCSTLLLLPPPPKKSPNLHSTSDVLTKPTKRNLPYPLAQNLSMLQRSCVTNGENISVNIAFPRTCKRKFHSTRSSSYLAAT